LPPPTPGAQCPVHLSCRRQKKAQPPRILNTSWQGSLSPGAAHTPPPGGPRPRRVDSSWGRAAGAHSPDEAKGKRVCSGEQLRWRILAQLLPPRAPAFWNVEPLRYAMRWSIHTCRRRSTRTNPSFGTLQLHELSLFLIRQLAELKCGLRVCPTPTTAEHTKLVGAGRALYWVREERTSPDSNSALSS